MKSTKKYRQLCLFLGWAGIHRFYLGQTFTGLIYFCTLGLVFIGPIIDYLRAGHNVNVRNAWLRRHGYVQQSTDLFE